MLHPNARDPFLLTNNCCGDSGSANPFDKGAFGASAACIPAKGCASAGPEVVEDNLGHANVVVTQNCQQPKRDLNTPRNPALRLYPDSGLNHNLVHLFLDEVHSHDRRTVSQSGENSR